MSPHPESLLRKTLRHYSGGTLFRAVRQYLLRSGQFERVCSATLAALASVLVVPLAAVIGITLWGSDLRPPRARRTIVPSSDNDRQIGSVELIVLTWNGADLLRKCLPSVVEAARNSPVPATILVVDNGSVDDTVPMLAASFPSVRVLSLPENYGFGQGNNRGVAASTADVVLLLNNDMVVDKDFVGPLLVSLREPATFAATSQIMMPDGVRREETGLTTGAFRSGRFQVAHAWHADGDDDHEAIPVFWAGGGSMAVRREHFVAMGGFDALYAPIYWEDVGLSYRARKLGLQVLMVPRSKVLHLHRSTMRRFPPAMVQRVVRRNEYLFTWANLHDWRWLATHVLLMPVNLAREIRADGPAVAVGALLMAMARLPAVVASRTSARRESVMTDRAVVGQFAPVALAGGAE